MHLSCEKFHDHILRAHRNFLRDAVYFLYEYNRLADAAYWYKYLSKKYPDKLLLDGKTNSLPASLTMEEYAIERVKEDFGERGGGQTRAQAAIEGLLTQSYRSLVLDEDARAAGFKLLASQLHESYQSTVPKEGQARGMRGVKWRWSTWRCRPRRVSVMRRYIQPADPVYQVQPPRPVWGGTA